MGYLVIQAPLQRTSNSVLEFMTPCKYSKVQKCKSCSVVFYNTCKKFLVAHAAELSQNIRPFKFTRQKFHKVAYSRDMNAAKSLALEAAIKVNSVVKKLSLSQVISLTISNEEIDGRVFYIECKQKVAGDPDKVMNVLQSFIDKIEYEGGCVFIYVAAGVVLNMGDITRI